jgi:hypothetical protein
MRFTLDHHPATTTMACLTMLDHHSAASAGQLSLQHYSSLASRHPLDHPLSQHGATASQLSLHYLPAITAGQLSLHHHSAISSPKLPVVFVRAGVAWRGVGTLAVALGVGGCLLRAICALFNT